MGQKTHPIGFRLGISIPWQARWFAARGPEYAALAIEDQKIREMIKARYEESGGISKTEIERGPQELVVSIHTARPGIVIGRGGTRVDELRADLEKLTGKRARLNIQEIRQPELDAYLVARNVATLVTPEHVGGPGAATLVERPNDGGVAADRDRDAEPGELLGIRGEEFFRLKGRGVDAAWQ